jgi:toxin-antitoxin system PIN domain toxin
VNAIDTNILVYASRGDSAFHEPALACVRAHAEGSEPWAIPWPCLHELLAVVTSPRIWKTPTPVPEALAQIDAWLGSPTVVLLAEEEGYWELLRGLVESARLQGPKVHDARIAALVLLHRIDVLLTADRDFSRLARIRTRNPL